MNVTKNSVVTSQGPADWFTGIVHVDPIADAAETAGISAASVHFTPGARTAWHTHPHGQTIYVTEGIGLAQARGGPIEMLRPGDRVFFEPGEEHWHGASPGRFMTHLAIHQVDRNGNAATWGRHVNESEYEVASRTAGAALEEREPKTP